SQSFQKLSRESEPAIICLRVASVAPTMPPSAESKVTTTPSTPGAAPPLESSENFWNRENAKLRFAAASVFKSCEIDRTVYIFTDFPASGSHLPGKILASSRSTRKTSGFTLAVVPSGDFNRESTSSGKSTLLRRIYPRNGPEICT